MAASLGVVEFGALQEAVLKEMGKGPVSPSEQLALVRAEKKSKRPVGLLFLLYTCCSILRHTVRPAQEGRPNGTQRGDTAQ